MPKQDAATPEPFRLGHDALSGLTVGPEALAVQQAGGLVHLEGEHLTVVAAGAPIDTGPQPEPLRVIDPKAGQTHEIKPGTKIE